MADFSTERSIKSVRKQHCCNGCPIPIKVGDPASYWSGITDGDFGSAYYHHECREAEVQLNKLIGDDWEWYSLSDIDTDEWPWLLEKHPIVAERHRVTQERIDELRAHHEHTRRFWAGGIQAND